MGDLKMPLYMLYPHFQLHERDRDWTVSPVLNLPQDYEERVPMFYQQGRRRFVEDYTDKWRKLCEMGNLGVTDLRLNWDKKLCLRNINLSTHAGLDLNTRDSFPHFQEHNLGISNAFVGAAIAIKYISELLKSK